MLAVGRRQAIIITRKSWVIGQSTDGSDGSQSVTHCQLCLPPLSNFCWEIR